MRLPIIVFNSDLVVFPVVFDIGPYWRLKL